MPLYRPLLCEMRKTMDKKLILWKSFALPTFIFLTFLLIPLLSFHLCSSPQVLFFSAITLFSWYVFPVYLDLFML